MRNHGTASKCTWNDLYLTGHAEIDRQHRGIFDLIAQLNGAGEQPPAAVAIELIDAITRHFAYENGLMAKYPYPGAEGHRHEHESIGRWTSQLRADVATGAFDYGVLQRFLHDWASHHAGQTDRRMAAFLDGRS